MKKVSKLAHLVLGFSAGLLAGAFIRLGFEIIHGRPAAIGGEALILPLVILLVCFGFALGKEVRAQRNFSKVYERGYQNKIMVYIGGEFRGQWMAEDCEVRRRFLQEQRHNILSGKQRAEFERLPKRRQKELREKYPMQYSCFTPQWSSFRALKRHFCANNQSIELVKV